MANTVCRLNSVSTGDHNGVVILVKTVVLVKLYSTYIAV